MPKGETQFDRQRRDVHPPDVSVKSLGRTLAALPLEDDEGVMLVRLVEIAVQLTGANEAFYFEVGTSGLSDQPTSTIARPPHANRPDTLVNEIHRLAQVAVREQSPQTARLSSESINVGLAVPVIRPQFPDEALAIALALETADSLPGLAQNLQILAAFVSQWRGRTDRTTVDYELTLAREIARLMQAADRERGANATSRLIAQFMRRITNAEIAAVLTVDRQKVGLAAIYPLNSFDKDSAPAIDMRRLAEEALEVAGVDADLIDVDHHAAPSQVTQRIQQVTNCQFVRTLLLRDAHEKTVAVVMTVGQVEAPARFRRATPLISSQLGAHLSLQRDVHPTHLELVRRRLQQTPVKKTRTAFWVAVAVTAAMFCPVPHTIKCNCVVESANRSFVVAPSNGVLQTVAVTNGEPIRPGAVIATIEDRETTQVLKELESQRRILETKKRIEISKRNSDPDAQARVESLLLQIVDVETRIRTTREQAEKLVITCPQLAGRQDLQSMEQVFVSDDIEKLIGSRVNAGQKLGEVVCVDALQVEVAIPDAEVSHVAAGLGVTAKFDSDLQTSVSGTLEAPSPRSEQQEDENVFIGIVKVEEADGLRPGMQGRAKISSGRVTLFSRLFRKPWQNLLYRIGW